MAEYVLDSKLINAIGRLPKRQRELALREIGQIEWQRCADDVIYWVDQNRHPAFPYVFTHDPHVYFTCSLCNDGNTYQSKHRKIHLNVVHTIIPKSEAELRGFFAEITTTRPFPLYDYMLPIID